MLQRTVDAALAAFRPPQLNQDTMTMFKNKEEIPKQKNSVINTSR